MSSTRIEEFDRLNISIFTNMYIDHHVPRTTTALIAEKTPRFIPARIPPCHHQLKNYLSTRCGDFIYYCSKNDVHSLHLPTNKRRVVKTLKWNPICLDAAYGWIGVGGTEKGQCAFIEIRGDHDDPYLPPYHHSEVDDLLPLDLDPDSRAILNQGTSSSRPSLRLPRYFTHENEIGVDIVNSVVIHRLVGGMPGLEDETVAILTNNDQTVSIFSLTKQALQPSPDEYPTAMNHASISPDGSLLLAVGDQPKAFFHKRVFNETFHKGKPVWTWKWQEIFAPRVDAMKSDDSCFTTGFSPSGHVCAVAAQSGVVTLFNTALISAEIDPENAVISNVRSSRTNVHTYRGAFRSMSFSPAPWDLLALGEDQGRVMIIDLRNTLSSAQTLRLDPKSAENVEIREQENVLNQRQLDIERRFLESHEDALSSGNYLSAVTNTADYVEFASDQRRRERESLFAQLDSLRNDFRGDPHRLSESERQTLESISNRRASASNSESLTPMSVNYSSGSNRFLPSASSWEHLNTTPSTYDRRSASITEYMRLRNAERSRAGGERSYQPRRRNSVIVSQNSSTNTNAQSSNMLAPITNRSSNLSTSPARLPSTSNEDLSRSSAEEPWQTITNAMDATSEVQSRLRRLDATVANMQENNARNRPDSGYQFALRRFQNLRELEAQTERFMRGDHSQNPQRLSVLRTQQRRAEDDDEESYLSGHSVDATDGVVTMGLGWSVDGRELFVATEVGIFIYKANTTQRGQFASIEWV